MVVLGGGCVRRREAEQAALVQIGDAGSHGGGRGGRARRGARRCDGRSGLSRAAGSGGMLSCEPRERIQAGGRWDDVMVRIHAGHRVGVHWERVGRRGLGHARLGLTARSVFVVRVLLHVQSSEPLGLVDKRPLVVLVEQFPFGA